MVGMGSMMFHEYDDVDLDIVWDTVKIDLPRLIALLEPSIPQEE